MTVLEEASAQYNDMLGTAAVDWHEGGGLHDFAKECGVDIERYFPLALSIYPALPEAKAPWKLGITIYAAEHSRTGSTGTEINAFARDNAGKVPTHRFSCVVAIETFFNAAKRFSVVLRPGKSTDVQEIEYDESTHPTNLKTR